MNWDYTPYAAALHITGVIALCVALLLARRRNAPGTLALIILMGAVAEWAIASGNEAASVGIDRKLFWAKIEYLGAVSAPTLFMIFTFQYRRLDRLLKRSYMPLYFAVPLIALILAFTNAWHGLIWSSYSLGPDGTNSVIYGHGIGYYVLIVYDYALVLTGIWILFRSWMDSHTPFRQQTGIILISAIFPIITGLAYTFKLDPFPGLDATPISFAATGVTLALGLLEFRLFELAPLPRHSLIENMDDGILVLDADDRVADINPMAETILSVSAGTVLGKPISEAMKSFSPLFARIQESGELQAEVQSRENPPRFHDLQVKSLYDSNNKFIGRLFSFRDITRYRYAENQLARQNDELEIIDRINLSITTGLDMAQTIKTLHEQCSHVVPIDLFYVALFDEEHSLVRVPLHYENNNYQTGTLRDISERPGTIGKVIRTRKTIYLNDHVPAVTGPLNLKHEAGKHSRSYLGIPLLVREKVVGVMCIQNYRPNAYRQEQIDMLERIAIHAAIAIENASLYAEVQRLAIIDELTGIYNYRGLKELGAREVERARRFLHPLSILFFDIDDFRHFNNKYSHTAGNIVLQTIVKRGRSVLRSVDVFARFGGDEFIALLPETDLAGAEVIARRLSDEIASTAIETNYGTLHVSISVGVSMLSTTTPDLQALIERANQAEHRAKQNQKSIVAISE